MLTLFAGHIGSDSELQGLAGIVRDILLIKVYSVRKQIYIADVSVLAGNGRDDKRP